MRIGTFLPHLGAAASPGGIVRAAAAGIVGALTGLGFSKDEAEYYDRDVCEGSTLVNGHDEGRAESIFGETGADRYRTSAEGTTRGRV